MDSDNGSDRMHIITYKARKVQICVNDRDEGGNIPTLFIDLSQDDDKGTPMNEKLACGLDKVLE